MQDHPKHERNITTTTTTTTHNDKNIAIMFMLL